MIDLFWTTVFCASLSILLSFIGYGVIAEKVKLPLVNEHTLTKSQTIVIDGLFPHFSAKGL